MIQQDFVLRWQNQPAAQNTDPVQAACCKEFPRRVEPPLLYHAHKDDLKSPRVLIAVPTIDQFVLVWVISEWVSDR
jgi:hypothetical protein